VPIIAVCPFCRTGRVRAPKDAIGQATICPKCATSFTVFDSGETEAVARQRVSPPPSVPGPRPEAPAARDTPTTPGEATALVDVPRPAPAPTPVPVVVEPEAAPTDALRVATIVAFLLAGVGLLVAHLPYGRFGTVAACAVGGLLGAACLFGARTPTYPAVAAGLNAAVLLVALVLPGWLGLDSWRPAGAAKEARTVQAFGSDGLSAPKDEWLPADRAWQLEDVRVRVGEVSLGQVELVGTTGQRKWSKKRYLQVRVRVSNVGVARLIEFQGWDLAPPKDTAGPKLTDADGQALAAATFDPGWQPVLGRPDPVPLPPSRGADQTFVFEAPAGPVGRLRLELPGAAFGLDQPARFQIAPSQVNTRLPQ
jgi:hypothetical protein